MSDRARKGEPGGLSLWRSLVFSAAGMPAGVLSVAVWVYLPPHFASHLGVDMALVGWAWAAVRILDVAVDPALGLVMDRTRTPLGRYRAWLVAGAPILMLGIHQLFLAPAGIGPGYLIGWLLVLYLGWSIFNLAHPAWAATLATGYHDRSRIFGVMAAVQVVSAVAVLMIPILAARAGRSEAWGVQAMGWFAILLTPVVVAAAASQTPERLARARAHAPVRLADYWSLIVKPDLVRLYLSQMALTLGPGWMSAMYLFFFKDVMRFTAGEASLLLLVYIIAGLAGAPLTAQLATRIGKHRTLMATTTAYSLGLCTVLLVPKGNVPAALPTMFWCGFMAAGFDLMIRAMLADVADEVRLEQGKERVSLIYALNGLAAKLAAALAIGVTFPLLARLGYVAQAGATNTPQAIHNLAFAFIVGPIIFVMLGGACLVGWRLDAQRHRTIRAALDDLDAQATLGIPDGEPTAAAAQLSDRERA